MKYIRYFETYFPQNDNFERYFKIGDIVICINNTDRKELDIEKEYIVNDVTDSFIRVGNVNDNYYNNKRFIKPEDFKEWKWKNDVKKFNV
jgi:hypothetical protein